MLGFDISERTVLRWMRKAPRNSDPAKRWAAFLSNHREAIAAMDFFTVPTLAFGTLYCFFIIAHDRRRILHCLRRKTMLRSCSRSVKFHQHNAHQSHRVSRCGCTGFCTDCLHLALTVAYCECRAKFQPRH